MRYPHTFVDMGFDQFRCSHCSLIRMLAASPHTLTAVTRPEYLVASKEKDEPLYDGSRADVTHDINSKYIFTYQSDCRNRGGDGRPATSMYWRHVHWNCMPPTTMGSVPGQEDIYDDDDDGNY